MKEKRAFIDTMLRQIKPFRELSWEFGIGKRTLDEVYRHSERKYIGDFDVLEYTAGFLPRKVFKTGEIILDGLRVTIDSSLSGWHVGLRPRKQPGMCDVFLAEFLLGFLDMTSYCLRR